jgi:predicted RNase H-like HicB family nuclease
MLVEIGTYYDGEFWCARGTEQDIFTQGSTLDELAQNIREGVDVDFGGTTEPIIIISMSR